MLIDTAMLIIPLNLWKNRIWKLDIYMKQMVIVVKNVIMIIKINLST
jgi:hypothetical protein